LPNVWLNHEDKADKMYWLIIVTFCIINLKFLSTGITVYRCLILLFHGPQCRKRFNI